MSLTQTFVLPNGVSFVQPLGLFIDGDFTKGIAGATFDVLNPTNETITTRVHEAREEDVDVAVKSASRAFKTWKRSTPSERGGLLLKLADLMEKNRDILASIETLEGGKPLVFSHADVTKSIQCIRYYAGWADKIHGKTINTGFDTFNCTIHEPIGVCGQIIPWNVPLNMWCWKVAPCVACGNTLVLKTAEQTPLSGLYAAKLVKEAGFPPGVINVVSGFGKIAGAAISLHMEIDKIAFTGSGVVGRSILRAAANSNLKKVTLELGGKSPSIVFDDADFDKAIEWVNMGIYANMGQSCAAGSRIYIQENIYDKFVEAFTKRSEKNVVGDPFDQKSFHGPQISKSQFERIMEYIQMGQKEGAKLETGGIRIGTEGFYIAPTVLSNANERMRIMQEEIFGPVCCISKFKTVDEVIEKANDTTYGLAAGIHTTSLDTAIKVSRELNAGTVWVNQHNMSHTAIPFGGNKESGIGRECGKYALSNYTQVKAVQINLDRNL